MMFGLGVEGWVREREAVDGEGFLHLCVWVSVVAPALNHVGFIGILEPLLGIAGLFPPPPPPPT